MVLLEFLQSLAWIACCYDSMFRGTPDAMQMLPFGK